MSASALRKAIVASSRPNAPGLIAERSTLGSKPVTTVVYPGGAVLYLYEHRQPRLLRRHPEQAARREDDRPAPRSSLPRSCRWRSRDLAGIRPRSPSESCAAGCGACRQTGGRKPMSRRPFSGRKFRRGVKSLPIRGVRARNGLRAGISGQVFIPLGGRSIAAVSRRNGWRGVSDLAATPQPSGNCWIGCVESVDGVSGRGLGSQSGGGRDRVAGGCVRDTDARGRLESDGSLRVRACARRRHASPRRDAVRGGHRADR